MKHQYSADHLVSENDTESAGGIWLTNVNVLGITLPGKSALILACEKK